MGFTRGRVIMEDDPNKHPKKHNYIKRIAVFDIDDVLPYICYSSKDPASKRKFAGHEVNLSNPKFILFRQYLDNYGKIFCEDCGVVGNYFALESAKNGEAEVHLNLYGYDKEGDEVLLTRDHILPKSKGGKDACYNMQVLCLPCNKAKGAKLKHELFISQMPTVSRGKILGALFKGTRNAGLFHHEQTPVYINNNTIKPLLEYLETLGLTIEN